MKNLNGNIENRLNRVLSHLQDVDPRIEVFEDSIELVSKKQSNLQSIASILIIFIPPVLLLLSFSVFNIIIGIFWFLGFALSYKKEQESKTNFLLDLKPKTLKIKFLHYINTIFLGRKNMSFSFSEEFKFTAKVVSLRQYKSVSRLHLEHRGKKYPLADFSDTTSAFGLSSILNDLVKK
ncbi:MAG: hypothetical protein JJ940_10580 [Balneola sp.]|nr:hypothetical protein [Balneola sp.]